MHHRHVVVITGASAGVGRATAREFARHGACIGLIARGRERLRDTAREMCKLGGEALVLPLDVADARAVDRAAARVEQTLGPIDIWVNNAMTSVFSPVRQMRAAEYRRVTEVTYLGSVHGTLAALKRMLPRDRCLIVQVGSALAYRSIPLQSAYCAAKHAQRGFTDSLRSELIREKSNVHLTMVHLPALNTPQFRWVKSRLPNKAQPVPPIYQPEVAGRAIYWAAHHRRRELHVGFSTLKTIWGNKLLPHWLDRYLADQAYEGQQIDEREDHDRPDNLWYPAPGRQAAHGPFDEQARSWSLQHWLSINRGLIGTIAGGAIAAGVFAEIARRSGSPNRAFYRTRAPCRRPPGARPLRPHAARDKAPARA